MIGAGGVLDRTSCFKTVRVSSPSDIQLRSRCFLPEPHPTENQPGDTLGARNGGIPLVCSLPKEAKHKLPLFPFGVESIAMALPLPSQVRIVQICRAISLSSQS